MTKYFIRAVSLKRNFIHIDSSWKNFIDYMYTHILIISKKKMVDVHPRS